MATEQSSFARQRGQLMRRYPRQYVAFVGHRMVDHDRNDETLAARMFRKFGEKPFYIGRLEENPAICEIPSPELAS